MKNIRNLIGVGLVLFSMAGCGSPTRPALGTVHGRVTMDGKPLKEAGVAFRPLAKDGRESIGITDDNGEYMLIYLRDIQGAAVGMHQVRITTALNGRAETVPACYNAKSELQKEVKRGDNEISFELKSKK